MTGLLKRLREQLGELRRLALGSPRAARSGERSPNESADRLVLTMHVLWLACVPVAVWMAAGAPPPWLAGTAIAALWVFAMLNLLTIGLAPLVTPFFLLWLAIPGNMKKAENWKDPQEEWEEGYEELKSREEELKAQGILPADEELPPKKREDWPDYIARAMPDSPYLPALRLIRRIAGLILFVALIVAGRPVLAAVFAFPALGWLALEAFEWAMIRWRGAH